jgi:hypothetical protein
MVEWWRMKTRLQIGSWWLAALWGFYSPATAQPLLWSQPPTRSGGFAADTDFETEFGHQHFSATVADNFYLAEDATVQSVVWWGFYYLFDVSQNETMRIRFYGARPGDELPDDNSILLEQTILNPMRELTGEFIIAGTAKPEYRYSVNLTSPISLVADTKYWLEIAQIGEANSDFYWEVGRLIPPDGIAGRNTAFPNWHFVGPIANMAFELTAPEPTTIALLLGGWIGLFKTRLLRK